jgi:benzylsuccinate CoA-transferase BbsF subunit
VDYSQQEAVMQMVGPAFLDYEMNGRVAGTLGNRHPLAAGAPHGVFPCAGDDRWISIAVLEDDEWRGLVRAMGGPDWATAPALDGAAGRVEQLDAIHEKLAAWTRELDDRELAERLQQEGVPAAPVLNVADLLDDPHYRARETFISVHHPLGFDETIYGGYVKMSRTPARVEPGPAMGRDNEFVFTKLLGLSEQRYRELVEQGVIH